MLNKGKILAISVYLIFSIIVIATPSLTSAQSGLVPCGYGTSDSGVVDNPCRWEHFFVLVTSLANYIIILGVAFSAVAFGWAGFLMMTASGEMSKIEHGKAIFGKVFVGMLIMLSAWLIVHAINAGLITSGFFGNSGITPI